VRDASGTPLASVPVAFTTAGTGFIAPANATTGVDGRASVVWTVSSNTGTTVQTDQVSVVVGALAPVTFSATVRPALRIRWIAGGTSAVSPLMRDTTGATLSDTLEVQVYDPTGGAFLGVAGKSVTWRVLAGDAVDGLAVNSVVTTDNNGRAKNRWVLRGGTGVPIVPSSIAKRMVATSLGIGEVEFQARVYPGSICAVSLSVGGNPVVGTSVASTAAVSDCNSYPVPGATVAFSVSAGSVAPTPVIANSSGLALTTWTFGTVPGVQTLSATASGKATPYNAVGDLTYSAAAATAQQVVAGAPTLITLTSTPSSPQASGTAVPITVTVTDVYGNPVSAQSVTFAVSGGLTAGSVSSASSTTGIAGTASVIWTLGGTGVNTLSITAGGAFKAVSVTVP
jgi:adhesin/invasin